MVLDSDIILNLGGNTFVLEPYFHVKKIILLCSHVAPINPATQAHVNRLEPSVQFPLLAHGLLEHSSISEIRSSLYVTSRSLVTPPRQFSEFSAENRWEGN